MFPVLVLDNIFLSDSLCQSWNLLWVDPFLAKPVCSVLFPCWSRKSLFHSLCYSWSLLWADAFLAKTLQCPVPLLILDNILCSLPSATSEVCSEQTPKTCLQYSVPLLILNNSLCLFPSLCYIWSLLWADTQILSAIFCSPLEPRQQPLSVSFPLLHLKSALSRYLPGKTCPKQGNVLHLVSVLLHLQSALNLIADSSLFQEIILWLFNWPCYTLNVALKQDGSPLSSSLKQNGLPFRFSLETGCIYHLSSALKQDGLPFRFSLETKWFPI